MHCCTHCATFSCFFYWLQLLQFLNGGYDTLPVESVMLTRAVPTFNFYDVVFEVSLNSTSYNDLTIQRVRKLTGFVLRIHYLCSLCCSTCTCRLQMNLTLEKRSPPIWHELFKKDLVPLLDLLPIVSTCTTDALKVIGLHYDYACFQII